MNTALLRIARFLLVLTYVAALLVPGLRAQAAALVAGPTDPAELEAFLDGVMSAQMSENHVPGAVVAVVRDGALMLAKGYGYADRDTLTPVDPARTLFRPGSISKLFVWTSVMQLFEQGKLDLDADINTYLDFTIPATFPEPITLKHLMAHTPGFEDTSNGLFVLQADAMNPLDTYLKEHLPARVFPPGELGAYSNYGTALAGYIVERVAGVPFYAYVEQNVFEPLGMADSTFRQPLPDNLAIHMSGGYNFVNGGYLQGDFEFVQAYPAGSLSAPATDMAKFMIAHLQNGQYEGRRILQEDTAVQMHRQLFTHDPRIDGMAYGFFENVINGQRVISHGGDTIFFHSGLFLLPEQNVGLFVSTNGAGGGGVGSAVIAAFLDRYYPVTAAVTPPPAADFEARIAPYLGEYYVSRSNYTTVEKIFSLFSPVNAGLSEDGYLVLTMGGETQQYTEIEPGLLQNRENASTQAVYRMDEEGQAYILPSMPFALIKTPWYGSMAVNGLLLFVTLALFLAALVRWPVGFFANLRKGDAQPFLARLAHWNAGLFALGLLAFVLGFLGVISDMIPAYGVPRIVFEDVPLMNVLGLLPWLMALAAFAMPVFMLLAWIKKYWTLSGRIFYTLLTLCGLAWMWMLAYWNFWL
ncbi:MAG: serine hydrolase domain-containing protein [Chloroflexota bacterium]